MAFWEVNDFSSADKLHNILAKDHSQEQIFLEEEALKQMPKIHYYVWGVSCHHSMVNSLVADREDGLKLWRITANAVNKQLWTADKGWSSSFRVEHRANNPALKKKNNVVTKHLIKPQTWTDSLHK